MGEDKILEATPISRRLRHAPQRARNVWCCGDNGTRHAVALAAVDQIVDIARAYFATRSRAAAEKYFWKNSLKFYKWKQRAKNQPSL